MPFVGPVVTRIVSGSCSASAAPMRPVTTPVTDWLVVSVPNPTWGASLNTDCWNCRRTQDSTIHGRGDSTGAAGFEVNAADRPTIEATRAARDVTCRIGLVGRWIGDVVAVDGLTSAVDVTVCGADSIGVTVRALAAWASTPAGRVLDALMASIAELFVLTFAVCGLDEAVARPSDVVTVVLAPPLACTVPFRGRDIGELVAASASVEEFGSGVTAAFVVGSRFGNADLLAGVESGCVVVDSDPVLVSVDSVVSGRATAAHGEVASPTPIPSATANVPSRPISNTTGDSIVGLRLIFEQATISRLE